ncbi:MAG: glycosyltransferase [Steroidobacteraceae bacterium]|jgi:glycosyltransferase involved in cell wall biosynthesis
MRVLWLSHVVPYPPKSGLLLRAFHLLKGVASRHEVDLVAFNQSPLMRALYAEPAEGLAECRRELGRLCRSVLILPIERLERPFGKARTAAESLVHGDGYTADWLRSRAAPREIRALAERRAHDVAHFDVISLARYRSLVQVPATLGHHNIESHMMRRRVASEPNPIKKAYFLQEAVRLARYERFWAPRFAVNIVCSDLDGERLRRTVPDSITRTIPNGVDCAYFRPTVAAEKPDSLIFVGTLGWYPNTAAVLFLLQEVFPRLRAVRAAATLDIVGANPPPAIVRAARRLAGVTLHGFLEDIRPVMAAATVVVCPIRDGGGTKLKILDACAMGKCIVAHPAACEGIAISPGVDIRLAESAPQFVRSIVELLGAPAERLAMGRAARELAMRRYSFDAIGVDMADLLGEIASQRHGHRAG